MSTKTELSKQQKKSQETKEKIFQAAKKILQKNGYEKLSIKNICEEAGVSNGSFYHHYPLLHEGHVSLRPPPLHRL